MIDFKDPKISKYLLGEMNEEEKLKFEDQIQNSSDLKQIIEELSPIYSSIKEELIKEELPITHFDLNLDKASKWKKFFYIFTPTLAAAGLAIVLVIPQLQQKPDNLIVSKIEDSLKISKNIKKPVTVVAKSDLEAEVISAPTIEAKRSGILSTRGSLNQSYAGRGGLGATNFSMKRKRVKGGSLGGIYNPIHSISDKVKEGYDKIQTSGFVTVLTEALSTFSIDVDTASYSNMRRFVKRGQKPPKDSVRIEEMINYFSYSYKEPQGDTPFSVDSEMTFAPWNKEHQLLRIGLKGKSIDWKDRKSSNLVFLLDVSGSMNGPNRLPLVKQGLRLMVENLNKSDRVSIVVYAGASGLVLPSTKGSDKEEILAAFDRLEAGGGTNGGSGINLAYKIAEDNFIKGGINRVILATDGDFNVGTTSRESLNQLIIDKAKSKVSLTVLGFGQGNLQDSQMESLADKGNGNYFYIDSFKEAKKVLVEQVGGNMVTIAKDVKIQVEFNPALVEAYRLIGYENRKLNKEDFNDDKKDAGEIGAGHYVTALYEIIPKGKAVPSPSIDNLKYQKAKARTQTKNIEFSDIKEWLTVKVRYKAPTGDKSKKLEFPFRDSPKIFAQASEDTRFAAGVAGFGMLLRDSKFAGDLTYKTLAEIAKSSKGNDQRGYRAEFIELIEKAEKTSGK